MGFIKAALSGGISSFRDSKFKEAVVLPESQFRQKPWLLKVLC